MEDSKDTKVEATNGATKEATKSDGAKGAPVTPAPSPTLIAFSSPLFPAVNDKIKSASHRIKSSASKNGKINPVVIGIAVVLAVVIVALILFFTVFNGNFTKGDIRSVDFYQSKSTRDVQEGTVKPVSSFKKGEPILVKISYGVSESVFESKATSSDTESIDGETPAVTPDVAETAPTKSVTFTYEIRRDNDDETYARKGSLPVTVTPDTKDGDRYISIVSSARTALEAGKYILEIRSTAEDGSRGEIIAKKTLKVTE